VDLVREIIECSSTLDATDGDQNTGLYLASLFGHDSIVDYLCACGANPNVTCIGGNTPLHAGVARDARGIVKRLVASGARGDKANHDGESPFDLAVRLERYECVSLLEARCK
jgi:ankyrin repeat protein